MCLSAVLFDPVCVGLWDLDVSVSCPLCGFECVSLSAVLFDPVHVGLWGLGVSVNCPACSYVGLSVHLFVGYRYTQDTFIQSLDRERTLWLFCVLRYCKFWFYWLSFVFDRPPLQPPHPSSTPFPTPHPTQRPLN